MERIDLSTRVAIVTGAASGSGRAIAEELASHGRPLSTLHGDQDALLPIRTDSDLYAQLVANNGREGRYRSYFVRGGNHVDSQFDDHWDRNQYGNTVLRPMLPCVRSAIDALVAWVETGVAPPPSRTIARVGTTADGLANQCGLGD